MFIFVECILYRTEVMGDFSITFTSAHDPLITIGTLETLMMISSEFLTKLNRNVCSDVCSAYLQPYCSNALCLILKYTLKINILYIF